MSTVAATLSASIISDDSMEDGIFPQHTTQLSVRPEAVGFCIGKHRANLRRIGNRIREDSGSSIFIQYVNTGNENGYFDIISEDRLAREQAKTALLDSETYFQKKFVQNN
jgi:hypothetical protein